MSEHCARDVHCLLGLPFDAVDMAGAVRRVRQAAAARVPCILTTPNLDFIVACRADPAFRDSVVGSDLCLADGMPIVWVARLLGVPIGERVAGSALFEALRAESDSRLAVYFFGGPDGAAEQASQRLNAVSAGLYCVGCACPGFGSIEDMSDSDCLANINASQADFLVVALGARKGQAWIERNRARLQVPVISHLGAVINHAAGTIRRAPAWMQRAGFEWLWRIREEPVLWRRYLRDGLVFAWLLASRVAPQVWHARRYRPPAEALAAAAVDTAATADLAIIVLRGAWGHDNLPRLRACLTDDFLAGRDVYVEMEAVNHVDSAFIGLLMLLYGYQQRRGRRLRLGPMRAGVRRTFEYSCAEFLCG